MNIKDFIKLIKGEKDRKGARLFLILHNHLGRYIIKNKPQGALYYCLKDNHLIIDSNTKVEIYNHGTSTFIINENTQTYCRLKNITFQKEVRIREIDKGKDYDIEFSRYEYHFSCDVTDTMETDGFKISKPDNILFQNFKNSFKYKAFNFNKSKNFNECITFLNDYFEKNP